MKNIRNLTAAAFCGALVILGMQSRTAAQENKWQVPPDREGSWDLIRIETTSAGFGHGVNPGQFPRETKDLPVGTLERKGISWSHGDLGIYGPITINAEVLFKKLTETVTIQYSTNQVDFNPDLFVKAEVIAPGRRADSFVVFKYEADIKTPSGYDAGKWSSSWDKRIYPEEPIIKTADRFLKKGEWNWNLLAFGGHPKAEEDFTLNVRILVFAGGVTLDYPASESAKRDPEHVDVTYHFYYKWAGWRDLGKPASSGSTATTKTTNKTNKPTTAVEEIPEDDSNNVAGNKSVPNSANKPPIVEEIPDVVTTNVPSNGARSKLPDVEEIPETRDGDRPATGRSGANGTNSSGTSGNNQAKNKPDKDKKPRDPNKPDIWTLLGQAARVAITGPQNPGVINDPGTNTNPNPGGGGGGGGGQSVNLAGTWNVTTQSTGDTEMDQNWTRTNVWQISSLGGGRWRVRQEINGQTYDENDSTVDEGGGRFRLIGSNPDGSTYQMSGTYNGSQFWLATSKGQNRITIKGTRQ